MEEQGDWSSLPICLLETVSDRLTLSADYVRFNSVCTSWRAVLDVYNDYRPLRQLPMLIIPRVVDERRLMTDREERKRMRNKRSLYSLSEKRVCDFMISIPDTVYCWGSDYGWLITVDTRDEECPVTLLNPFLPINNKIVLPSLRDNTPSPTIEPDDQGFLFHYADKYILSANPTTSTDFAVMAIFSAHARLMIWKPSYKVWKFSGEMPVSHYERPYRGQFRDIIYYRDQCYAVNQFGEVMVVVSDIVHPEQTKFEMFARPPAGSRLYLDAKKYLVESSGELFQLDRERTTPLRFTDTVDDNGDAFVSYDQYSTYYFQVFKSVAEKGKNRTWVEVHTLDGHAFFVGHGTSMSVLASDFPGCKPNCIYFTDDYHYRFLKPNGMGTKLFPTFLKDRKRKYTVGPHDIGIFNVEDKSVERHYQPPESIRKHIWPNPIWIEPTICQSYLNQ